MAERFGAWKERKDEERKRNQLDAGGRGSSSGRGGASGRGCFKVKAIKSVIITIANRLYLCSVVRKDICLENARPVVEEVEDAAVVDLEGEDLMTFSKYQNKKSHA